MLLTPGVYNSAYFEHAFLARQMGIELVEGRDLVVHDNIVYMRTTAGLRRVDVIYRRVDDDFIDPLAFRPDSVAGRRRPVQCLPRRATSRLANALGTGVADDKALYAYVPAIIKYFLGEDPILNNVETFVCSDPAQRQHVLGRSGSVRGEGGGRIRRLRHADRPAQHGRASAKSSAGAFEADPRNYIAQPTLALSRAPCFIDGKVEPRHVDLRPYILYGDQVTHRARRIDARGACERDRWW